MIKINTPLANGGAPLYNDDLLNLQNEAWKGINGILSMFDADTQGVVLSGCVATYTGTLAITAGYVYLNGDVMYFPGASGVAAPAYIVPDTVANESRDFEDGSNHVVVVTKNSKVITGSTPSPQYIKIDTNVVVRTLLSAMSSKITPFLTKVINIGAWNMQGGTSKNVAHGLSLSKIVYATVSIINDALTTNYPLVGNDQGLSSSPVNGTHETDVTNVSMWSTSTGTFGGTSSFSSTSNNRGYITIYYLP